MNETFLSNKSETTFLERLRDYIRRCDEFWLSVSFIKARGLNEIKDLLEERLKAGAKGKLLTTTYKEFTDYESLKTFLSWQEKYPSFQCRLDYHCLGDVGFHTKGYIFKIDGEYRFLVGSTSLTYYALRRNAEWNVSLDAKLKEGFLLGALSEFDALWAQCKPLSQELIDEYRNEIEISVNQWDLDENDFDLYSKNAISPNPMQVRALREIQRYRKLGANKALVIAATGSGKTYLAAFDARRMNAQKLLFVVHRDTILLSAMETFANVFLSRRTYGVYNGSKKDLNADFVFASNATLALHLSEFDPEQFDYIVFDECHHITGDTYQKILSYFKPAFTLGLTATPERLDNKDVFDYFGNNVPYELRLKDAISNSLVVPFHYYGIRDEFADYSRHADRARALSVASESQEHIDFIVSKIDLYAPKSEKLKAVVFCRNKSHAKTMADAFAQRGFPSTTLLGEDSMASRVHAYSALQDDASELSIICAVDILNEGIDVPGINMVVFLRPTESHTVFIQQLGRGLRKAAGKEFLTVLDFIGNSYERAFNIARALGGVSLTASMSKPDLRNAVRNNFAEILIPGVSVQFDQKSIEEVLRSIEKTNFNRIEFVKADYANFKSYLGISDKASFPTHLDYLNDDAAPNLIAFIRRNGGTTSGSYYKFLKDIGEEVPSFDEEQVDFIAKLSSFLPLVRKDEFLIIEALLEGKADLEKDVPLSGRVNKATVQYGVETLLKAGVIVEEGKRYRLSVMPKKDSEFESFVNDILSYGLGRYEQEFGDYQGLFKRYASYDKNRIMQTIYGVPRPHMPGTLHDTVNHVTYLFVNLNKDKYAFNEGLAYKDRFLSPGLFQWESVNNTTLDNAEGKKLLSSRRVHLFVRRVETEDGITMPFVYMGEGHFENERAETNEGKPTLLFDVKLDDPVDEGLYFEYDIPHSIIKRA